MDQKTKLIRSKSSVLGTNVPLLADLGGTWKTFVGPPLPPLQKNPPNSIWNLPFIITKEVPRIAQHQYDMTTRNLVCIRYWGCPYVTYKGQSTKFITMFHRGQSSQSITILLGGSLGTPNLSYVSQSQIGILSSTANEYCASLMAGVTTMSFVNLERKLINFQSQRHLSFPWWPHRTGSSP